MGHVGSKTRSLLEKPCVNSRGHIFSPIIKKLGRNYFVGEILDKFVNGSCGSLHQMLEKKNVYAVEGTFSVR